MTIRAGDHIETAFSADDANAINPIIEQAVAADEKVVIDFTGINFFTTLFFSSAITRYVDSLGPDEYDRIFEIIGLTEIGQTAYDHSLEFAREESQLTPEQKEARLAALDLAFDME